MRGISGLTVAIAVMVSACGSGETRVAMSEDATITRATDGNYRVETADGGTGTIATGGSALDRSASEISAMLPPWAPLYPGSRAVSAMKGSDGQGAGGAALVVETRDPLAQIARFYDERIAASGMEAQMRADQPDNVIRVVGDSDGKRATMISASDGGDLRTISITFQTAG